MMIMNGPQVKVFVGRDPKKLEKEINDFLEKLSEDVKKKGDGCKIINRTFNVFSRQTMSGNSIEMHVSIFYDLIGHGFITHGYEQIKIFHHLHDIHANAIVQEANEFMSKTTLIEDLLFASCLDFGECSPCIAIFYDELY